MSEKTVSGTEEKTADLLKEPGRFAIILHNDDYTTMDFVVTVLKEIFHKNAMDANKIMLDVHKKGRGRVGVFPYDIAATKMFQVENRAAKAGYPLKCTMEKE